MKIIDAHIHFSNIGVFEDTAEIYSGAQYSGTGLLAECAANNITGLVAMGLTETVRYGFPDNEIPSPMGCDLPGAPDFLKICFGINPHKIDLRKLESLMPDTAGIKIYAGYYHFDVYDPVYDPVYRLAAKYNKPVVIHTGDTYSERGLIKYSHPLHVDQLAYNYRDVDFIIAHIGTPWVMDACEVVYKNRNVYTDMSGLLTGEPAEIINVTENEPLICDIYRQGLMYLNSYKKVLFGTDWPLTAMKPYIEFCKTLVPEENWPEVFYDNAAALFKFV
jgi:hypothetical protein